MFVAEVQFCNWYFETKYNNEVDSFLTYFTDGTLITNINRYLNLIVNRPEVFKYRINKIKLSKKRLYILGVEFTWTTCFDLV